MEPVYMHMQSYPHQDPIHYRPRCYSGMEARPPMNYGCWPWGGNYGYAAPGACHGCSPYSHVPSYHCPGNYPYVPAQCMPPPPYNVMEHPRYEYEKNVAKEHHCCGCPNHHPLHPKEQRNVRIEEEEPERERRKNDSLVPLQFKNSPYPIVWLAPDYREHGKVQNAEDVKVRENGKNAEQQPPSLKGWLPVDLNNVVSSKQRGEREKNDHQDDGKRNFQFPLFWMPYKPDDMERESHKVKDVNPKPSLESEKGSAGEQNFHVNRGNAGDQTASRAKDIPVQEAEQHVGKESSIIQEKERDTSVRDRTDKGEKKIDNVEKVSPTEGSKRKSPSPPKSSKLPPVCLRVDPLPRKKNGKSQSPSPPGDKQKLEVKSNEASKAHSLDNEEQVKKGKDTKTIAVVDGSAPPEKSMNVNVETPGKQAEVKPEEEHKHAEYEAVVKGQSEDIVSGRGENEESLRADGMKVGAVKKCRELSEEEAAVIIQSAYRRFDVCRWKPIEKLKLIARVREQIADVKRLIQELELSSDIQGRAKQKNIIVETIMSLLLKLDTIQGLHPSIREVRKSVVRELVSLQEQLDSLMSEKPEDSPTKESMMRCDHEDVMKSVNGNEINSVDLQNQIDGGSNSEEANLIEEAASVKIGMEASESCVDEEGTNHSAGEENSNKSGQSKQLEEALIGSPIVEESHYETSNKENHQTMEAHDGVELGTKKTEIGGSLDNCKLDDKFEEKVDSRSGDARSETTECTPQQLENFTADLIEPSEASDERELPTDGSMMEEEPLESLLQDGDLEKTSVINEHANTCDAVDMVEVAAETEGAVDVPPEMEVVSKQGQECNTQHPPLKEATEKQKLEGAAEHEENNADIRESNRRLMEENERLRDMMEKLIKSGQEQLTAISSLSGRVKEMEKRLSRKKKLKVKQFKAPRSSKFNGSDGEKKTIGVAM